MLVLMLERWIGLAWLQIIWWAQCCSLSLYVKYWRCMHSIFLGNRIFWQYDLTIREKWRSRCWSKCVRLGATPPPLGTQVWWRDRVFGGLKVVLYSGEFVYSQGATYTCQMIGSVHTTFNHTPIHTRSHSATDKPHIQPHLYKGLANAGKIETTTPNVLTSPIPNMV